jgi:hypothetical protein
MTNSLHSLLTLPLARQALFESFWISQGDPALQQLLFGWLHLARPAWRVTNDLLEPLVAQLTRASLALVARGGHTEVNRAAIEHEVRVQAARLQEELACPFIADEEEAREACRETLAALVRMCVARDYRFLCEAARERPLSAAGSGHPHRDRWFSFVCYYLLAHHQLGCLAFDELLVELRRTLRGEESEASAILHLALHDQPALPVYLEELTEVYLQHHPQTTLDLTPFRHALLGACLKPIRPSTYPKGVGLPGEATDHDINCSL